MLEAKNLCKVRIITDCTTDGVDDINHETLISVLSLREIYYDLKESSSVILHAKRFTAVSENRLLSILILNEDLYWSDIIDERKHINSYS